MSEIDSPIHGVSLRNITKIKAVKFLNWHVMLQLFLMLHLWFTRFSPQYFWEIIARIQHESKCTIFPLTLTLALRISEFHRPNRPISSFACWRPRRVRRTGFSKHCVGIVARILIIMINMPRFDPDKVSVALINILTFTCTPFPKYIFCYDLPDTQRPKPRDSVASHPMAVSQASSLKAIIQQSPSGPY